jgi:plastocyanin
MNRAIPILAFVLIAIGIVGLIALGWVAPMPFSYPQGYGVPGGGMMDGRGGHGMMGGYGYAPNANATPVPSDRSIDREVKITARNLRFDPTRVAVKKGETIRFTIANQDGVAHNFVSQDGAITYTFLPPNATQSVVWVAPERGTYTAFCTFHAGMQLQIVVE